MVLDAAEYLGNLTRASQKYTIATYSLYVFALLLNNILYSSKPSTLNLVQCFFFDDLDAQYSGWVGLGLVW